MQLLATLEPLVSRFRRLAVEGRFLSLDLGPIISLKGLEDLLAALTCKSFQVHRAVAVLVDEHRDCLLPHRITPIAPRTASGSVVRSASAPLLCLGRRSPWPGRQPSSASLCSAGGPCPPTSRHSRCPGRTR